MIEKEGFAIFETRISPAEGRRWDLFLADADHILVNILHRARYSQVTRDELAMYLSRIASWDERRPSVDSGMLVGGRSKVRGPRR